MSDSSGMPPRDGAADERDDDILAVRVRVTPEEARKILEAGRYDIGDRPRITPNADGTGSLDLFVTRAQAAELEAQGTAVEVGHNQSARARARIAELSEGDRYEGGQVVPRGVGKKVGGRGGSGPSGTDSQERGS